MAAFHPLRTLAAINSVHPMRWVIALAVLVLLAAIFYALAIRDRTFDSYGGARVGMGIGAALQQLKDDGYLVVHVPDVMQDRGCTGRERYALVWGQDPMYHLTVSVDERCKVREIKRKLRFTWDL